MKKITLLIALMITSLGFAQQVLIEDFETPASYTFAGFEGLASASIQPDPAVGAAKMNGLRLVSQSTGNPWQGAEVVLQNSKIQLTTDKTVKIDVYATQAFTLLGKVEMGGAGPNSAASQSYTTPGAWQTLTITFNQSLDGTGVANGDYQKIVFFPNWKATNDGFNSPPANFTVHIDNINGVKVPLVVVPDPAPTIAAPTPPARLATDVVSIYSDAYTNISPIANFDAGWCGGTATTAVTIAGNNTLKKNAGKDCHGINFDTNRQNLTAFTYLHFDFYVMDTDLTGDVFNVKLVNFNNTAGETSVLEVNINGGTTPPLVANQWVSVDVPITALGGVVAGNLARNDIAQIGITTAMVTSVYYDNIYLHKGTTLGTEKFETSSVKMYPNPVKNTLTIDANSAIQRVSVYNILGQEVLKASPKTNSVTLQTNELQKGVYMVTTEIDGKVSTSKVVKE
jgi:hypothetical protein